MSQRKNPGVRIQDLYKDERPTSNIERPMMNQKKYLKIAAKSRTIKSRSEFISIFDVGRSMFDVHSFSSIKTI
jgi:hypothetical protein